MTAYALFWELLKHILHGRGRDEVFLSVEVGFLEENATGTAEHFTWTDDRDAFCVIQAVSQ